MGQDWIRMRTDLYRDPKVLAMSDLLADVDGELGRYVDQNAQCRMAVTRNVIRNAVLGGLQQVWGTLRHRGKRDGDDLVVKSVTLAVLDDIADLPGFGDAMEAVGWVRRTSKGLVLPRFFEQYNSDPEVTAAAKKAARQKRYRERHSGATRGALREEKRREN